MYCTKYVAGSTEDEGAEDDEAEDDTEDDNTEDGKDNDTNIKGTVLSMEALFNSMILGHSKSETWESQAYQPSRLKRRHGQVCTTTEENSSGSFTPFSTTCTTN
jgi:hypothetical protein